MPAVHRALQGLDWRAMVLDPLNDVGPPVGSAGGVGSRSIAFRLRIAPFGFQAGRLQGLGPLLKAALLEQKQGVRPGNRQPHSTQAEPMGAGGGLSVDHQQQIRLLGHRAGREARPLLMAQAIHQVQQPLVEHGAPAVVVQRRLHQLLPSPRGHRAGHR